MNTQFEYKGRKVEITRADNRMMFGIHIDGRMEPKYARSRQAAVEHAKQLIDAEEGK